MSAATERIEVPLDRVFCPCCEEDLDALIALPVAAGALYPSLGVILRPEIGALAMSSSSITVVTNALLLRRAEATLATSR